MENFNLNCVVDDPCGVVLGAKTIRKAGGIPLQYCPFKGYKSYIIPIKGGYAANIGSRYFNRNSVYICTGFNTTGNCVVPNDIISINSFGCFNSNGEESVCSMGDLFELVNYEQNIITDLGLPPNSKQLKFKNIYLYEAFAGSNPLDLDNFIDEVIAQSPSVGPLD